MAGVWKILVQDYFSRWIKPDDAVLDAGAGPCHFINNVKARRRVAVDANPNVAKSCAPGVEFILSDDFSTLPDQCFNVIFMSNFLEHLDNGAAVVTVLSQLRQRLAPGGRMIILQPNFALVGARYFDFIDHKTILTDASLSEALALAGLRVEWMRRRFLPYTSKSRLPKTGFLVRLYLKMPLAQYFMGKQTLVVAQAA